MSEYFIDARSFAAPFVSDSSTHYVTADSPQAALEKFAKQYRHPCGLYAADCYARADDLHKGRKALARWLCNRAAEEVRVTAKLGSYMFRCNGADSFEVNGRRYNVENPKQGAVLA